MRTKVRFVLPAAALTLGACASQHPTSDPRTIARTPTDRDVEGRPTLADPIPIPGQSSVLVPFAVESMKGLFESSDPYRRSGGLYDSAVSYSIGNPGQLPYGGDVRWHNAIVRDLKTGQEWPILQGRGVIGRWQMLLSRVHKDELPVSRGVIFIAVVEDTNHDGVLDDRDARVAILTDADGRNPRVVSPPQGQVWTVHYDPEKNLVFMRVAADTNGDGKFSQDDVATPYMIAAGAPGPAERVVSEAAVSRVESALRGDARSEGR